MLNGIGGEGEYRLVPSRTVSRLGVGDVVRIICCHCGRLESIRLLGRLVVIVSCCVATVYLLCWPPAKVYSRYGSRLYGLTKC